MLPILLVLLAFPLFAAAQSAAEAYTPVTGQCPPGFSLVRDAGISKWLPSRLSAEEDSYVRNRRANVLPNAWKSYLANVKATNVTLPNYVSNILSNTYSTHQPNFAIATSGGGYRAAIFGAGVINALDGRNPAAVSTGTGGLLQGATYFSGLSGGSWLVTSLAQSDFPTIKDLIFGSDKISGWLAQFDVLAPSSDPRQNGAYIQSVFKEILGKFGAGFHVTITDLWARGLSRHFITGTSGLDFFSNSSAHGAGVTFSGLSKIPSFAAHEQPFPIILANLLSSRGDKSNIMPGPNNNIIPLTNPIFEMNVFETGSFDPNLAAFTPTKFLGTKNKTACVTNFDQAGFLMGTSANVFNSFNTSEADLLKSPAGPLIQLLNSTIPQPGVEIDAAQYPNPFKSVKRFMDRTEENIVLVDGGDDGQSIPFQPLLVKPRGVDVILAIDGSADTNDSFADGSALIATQRRVSLFPSSYSFPPVPSSPSGFASLVTHPTFFGCNSKPGTPLVIYMPNGGPPRNGEPPATNTPTLQLAYPPGQIQTMLNQTFTVATQGLQPSGGKGLVDKEWAVCLACAVADRSRARMGTKRSGVCVRCFERYCWKG